MAYVVPPINTKGTFTFSVPFDTLLKPNLSYKVTAVRELLELKNSEEKPYETIYVPVGLTEADFVADLDANIPIVVLVTEGNEYIYVPANRIQSMPDITGVRYQDKILAISLGSLPVNMDLTLATTIVTDDIYASLGIQSSVQIVPSSAVILKPVVDDATFRALLANRSTVTKSYKTRYHETLTLLNARDAKIAALEAYAKAHP